LLREAESLTPKLFQKSSFLRIYPFTELIFLDPRAYLWADNRRVIHLNENRAPEFDKVVDWSKNSLLGMDHIGHDHDLPLWIESFL
jgi:hypothetical protein